jgi:hypothetical protein
MDPGVMTALAAVGVFVLTALKFAYDVGKDIGQSKRREK